MPYPHQILPAPGNKTIDCNVDAYYLIRHVDIVEGEDIINPETEFIRPEYICGQADHIEDLSSSLLGIFEPHFIHLEFTEVGKGKYVCYCNPNDQIEPPSNEDFTTNFNRSYWTIQIAQMNGKQFDYTMKNEPYVATCWVKHTPMRWNFWHFSFRWTTNNLGPLEDLEPKDKQKVARRIGVATRHLVCHYAKLVIPGYPTLPQACYRVEVHDDHAETY